jgi:hypothetical protein
MIDLKKILNEDVGSIWSPKQYQASSMAPRKDQGPLFSQKDGKNYPYQNNFPGTAQTTTAEPQKPETFPWPMENINSDLADGLIFILEAAKKISQCQTSNKSLSSKQKDELLKVFKYLIKISKSIEKVGMHLPKIVNMSSETQPQIPMEPSQSPYIPSIMPVNSQQNNTNTQPQKL